MLAGRRRGWFSLGALLLALALAWPAEAAAPRKLALLIGNSAYANLSPSDQLVTPINDVRAVGAKLQQLGFEVALRENLGRQDFLDAVLDFANRVGRDDIAFFYYAGHGVNFGAGNLYLPSDIPAPRAAGKTEEARIAANTISETQIKEALAEARPRIFLAVFDACRNNPLLVEGSTTRSLGGQGGIVIQQPPEGVAVLYSAGERQTALDRLRSEAPSPELKSVFARVFVAQLGAPGLSLTQMGRNIQRQVREMARGEGHDQRPAFYDELGEDFYLVPGAAPQGAAEPAADGGAPADIAREWDLASATRDEAVISAFLAKHGDDPLYRALAEKELKAIRNPILESLKLDPAPPASETSTYDRLALNPAPVSPPPTGTEPQDKGWQAVVASAPTREAALATIDELRSSGENLAQLAYFVAPSLATPGAFDIRFGSGEKTALSIICVMRGAMFRQAGRACDLIHDKAFADAAAACGAAQPPSLAGATLAPLPELLARGVMAPNASADDTAELMVAQLAEGSLPMLGIVCNGEAPPAGAVERFQQRLDALGYLKWPVAPGVIDDQTRTAAIRLFAYGM